MLDCKEFVNADNIAAGLAPDDPESVALYAGRLMLQKINDLLLDGGDFAFETTLSTRSYVSFIHKAKRLGYRVSLVYIWLSSPDQAKERVAIRVKHGGHNIPTDVIERRYYKGIYNLFNLFIPLCDYWVVGESTLPDMNVIASGSLDIEINIKNADIWDRIVKQSEV
jgi:predicted ABC-type ATPase